MANINSKHKTNPESSQKQPATGASAYDSEVEVLYQKMGDRWFAFSLVEDEVFIGSISQEEIDAKNKIRSA